MRRQSLKLAIILFAGFIALSPALFSDDEIEEEDDPETLDCDMRFNLQSWSLFYHYGKGEGKVSCSDGQEAEVVLRIEGGGIINVGAYNITDGYGKFSPIRSMDEIFGTYAATGGDIALGNSMSGINVSKTKGGRVVLNLSGGGEGFGAGWHYSNFTIKPKETLP